MSRSLMSLCLFGAALAPANALFLQRTTCPSEHKETAALNSVRKAPRLRTRVRRRKKQQIPPQRFHRSEIRRPGCSVGTKTKYVSLEERLNRAKTRATSKALK